MTEAPPAADPIVATYDRLAPVYDARYSTAACAEENAQVAAQLEPSCRGKVLDLGCGTGLLLDLLGTPAGLGGAHITPSRYLGVDPSPAMLARLQTKHPGYPTLNCRAEDLRLEGEEQHLIVALFGAASYIHWETLLRLPTALVDGGRLFLMAYRPGYAPDYEQPQPRFGAALDALTELATAYSWPMIEWHQFRVLDGIRNG